MATKNNRSLSNKNMGQKLRPLQRFAMFFFSRSKLTAAMALTIAAFGVLSYTTLLKREGFPPISVPYAIGQATYFVNDASQVDRELAKPVSEFLMKQSDVKTVQTNSLGNFATVIVQYKEKQIRPVVVWLCKSHG
ncbi:efflux RND transporter permease subunit [Candidatus Saccharibacteria bacterium]|nr:MAG: efflux RND transporter permease subunit [Candidatus Saccharibacteria bacterium]